MCTVYCLISFRASLHHKSYKKNIDRSRFKNKCKYCDKTFLKPSQLIRHTRVHTGERPFKCVTCNRAFNQKGALQLHMVKHTGIKEFSCEFCNKKFAQRGNLRCHIQVRMLSDMMMYFYFLCPAVLYIRV